ncbi:MAG TPA: RNA 2',3'-cyclic phosphodiesterase [Thermoplasmata archaeon]|nr:RNA 2',3'-cyclic phosphodiesterase [Thermoplasmata archaeon]
MREFVALEVGGSDGGERAPQHLTLRFLGEVAPERNDRLAERLSGVARAHRPFTIRLEGVGAFPSPARPRVVWVGVTAGRSELVALADAVRAALEPEFGRAAEPFVPHLTLWRVRSPADRAAALELLGGHRPAPSPRDVEVRELLLKESRLGAGGAVHRTVRAFPLEAPRAAPP